MIGTDLPLGKISIINNKSSHENINTNYHDDKNIEIVVYDNK
jgi:hypothetical protein